MLGLGFLVLANERREGLAGFELSGSKLPKEDYGFFFFFLFFIPYYSFECSPILPCPTSIKYYMDEFLRCWLEFLN